MRRGSGVAMQTNFQVFRHCVIEIIDNQCGNTETQYAAVSELADEADSKSVTRKGVWVRVPSAVPLSEKTAVSLDKCGLAHEKQL